MKNYRRWIWLGLAVALTAAGCGSSEETAETSASRGEVTKLGTYKGVKVTKMDTTVTDEEIEAEIESLLADHTEYTDVTDRPAASGDTVNIDYVGLLDGEAFEGGTADGYDLVLGSGSFIDGFEDGLIGAVVGEERSLNLTFPDPYYNNPDLAGAAVVFDVTVNAIREPKEAVLDDAFAQSAGYDSVEVLRAGLRSELEAEKEEQAAEQLQNDAFQIVLDDSEFTLDEAEVDALYEKQLSYYESMISSYGMTLSDYAGIFGMTEDGLKEQIYESSEIAIRQQLLTKAIVEAEGLTLTDEYRQIVADFYGMDLEELQENYGEEAVDETALIYLVLDFIAENAVVAQEVTAD